MAENILNIDLYESAHSCSEDEMIDHFRRAAEAEKAKGNGKTEFQDLYEASKKHKKLATALYNIYEATRRDSPPKTVAKYIIDNEGKPALQIYRQLEGGHFDFSIHDGKVILPEGLSEDKLLEVLDFLYRRGITNFELPASQRGTGFEELCQKVQAKREADPETHMSSPQSNPRYIPQEELEGEDAEAALARPGAIGLSAEQPQGTKKQSTEKAPDPFDKVVKDFKTWLETSQGKNKNSGYYIERGSKSKTFSVYDNNNNKDNDKNDGRKDKNGVIQEKGLLYRVKLIQKEGKLAGIEYYIPNNGKLPDPLADRLAAMVKSQKALYMDFKEAPTQADAGVIRLACARAGIIPRGEGFNLNEIHAQKMIQEAENNLSEKDALKYKGQLGRHLLGLCNGNTEDRRYEMAIKLINQETFTPMKDCFEQVIKPEIEQKGRGSDAKAEEVIGSAKAAQELYQIYEVNNGATLEQLLNSDVLDAQSKQLFMQNLQANDIVPPADTPLQKMNIHQLKALFNALEVKHTQNAKSELIAATDGLSKKEAHEEVRDMLNDAKAGLQDIVANFDAKGLKGVRAPYLGNPKFENGAPTQTQSTNTQETPRRTLNIGGLGGRGSM